MRRISAVAAAVILIVTLWTGQLPAGAATAPLATSVSLTVQPATRAYSAPGAVAVVAVRAADGRTPAGRATVMVDGGTAVASAQMVGTQLQFVLPRNLSVGTHRIYARYDPKYLTAYSVGYSALLTIAVTRDPSTLTFSGPGQVLVGNYSQINISVGGSAAVSTGAVTLSLDGGARATKTLSAGKSFFWVPATMPLGVHRLQVTYGGSGVQAPTTATRVFTVVKGSTTVSTSLSAGSIVAGQSVTATVSVRGPWATAPTGTVTILVDGNGYRAIPAGAASSVRISGLGSGTHRISALYGGDARHLPSRSDNYVTVSSSPCPVSARACIDLTNQLTWLQSGGRITYGPVPITSGRPGYRTPAGSFSVWWKDLNHVSSTYHAPMPYSVFFNGGIAFHEGSLSVASHGCIHLSGAAASTYFSTLQLGDQVYVWGYAPY